MFKLTSVAITLSLAAAVDIARKGGRGKKRFDGCDFADEAETEAFFNAIIADRDPADTDLPADAITGKELKRSWKELGGGKKWRAKQFFEEFAGEDEAMTLDEFELLCSYTPTEVEEPDETACG